MMQNFVIVDVNNNVNNVIIYDEHDQGKGVEASCSLCLLYRLQFRQQVCLPKILLLILDNFVGQNKYNVVLMFYVLMSLHNLVDRVYGAGTRCAP